MMLLLTTIGDDGTLMEFMMVGRYFAIYGKKNDLFPTAHPMSSSRLFV